MDFLEEKEVAPLAGKGDVIKKSNPNPQIIGGKAEKNPPLEKTKIQVMDSKDKTKPLGNMATPGITPKTSSGCEEPDNEVDYVKQKKMTVEQFIEKTSKLNGQEFAKFMLESNSIDKTLTTVSDLFGNEFTPEPNQTIQYVCGLILNNLNMMRRFVMEVRRRDGLHNMMEELMDHGESYSSIVNHLECPDQGETRCGRLADELNNSYANVVDKFEVSEDMFPESTSPGVDDLYGDNDEETHEEGPEDGLPPMDKKMSSGDFLRKPKAKLKFKGKSAAHHMMDKLLEYPHFKEHVNCLLKTQK
jgi:hypothetical protein